MTTGSVCVPRMREVNGSLAAICEPAQQAAGAASAVVMAAADSPTMRLLRAIRNPSVEHRDVVLEGDPGRPRIGSHDVRVRQ
jgi:hypothetical protein